MALGYWALASGRPAMIDFPMPLCRIFWARGDRRGSPARGLAWASALILCLSMASCSFVLGGQKAQLWTSCPALSQYVEDFNAQNGRHHIELVYVKDLDKALRERKDRPALAAGYWLKNSRTRSDFLPVDKLFTDMKLNAKAFYPDLLKMGRVGARQVLIPLSFNLPTVIFSDPDQAQVKAGQTIDIEDMRRASLAFNQAQAGGFSRMGFSPRWDSGFLYASVAAFGPAFRESKPLSYNEDSLQKAIDFERQWVKGNSSVAAEDEYRFRYLYDPSYKSVVGGRALFAYLSSADFFLLPEETRDGLDYRWLSYRDRVDILDDVTMVGLCRRGSGMRAAEAFLAWLYRVDTQSRLLESSRQNGTAELIFGINGGFSALRPVTENILPSHYPSLLSHKFQGTSLNAPASLPANWPEIKQGFLIPYLYELASQEGETQLPGQGEIQSRIDAWLRERPLR